MMPEDEDAPIVVRGYRGDAPPTPDLVAIVKAAHTRDTVIQIFDAAAVVGRDHLVHAARLARRARAEGRHKSEDLALAVLVYASGERQIAKALARTGAPEGRGLALAAVALGGGAEAALDTLATRLGWRRDDAVLEASEAKLDRLGVEASLRAAIPRGRWPDLALERVSLIDLQK